MKRILIEISLLLLISCFVIFYQFNQIPKKLSWDEVEFARLALSLENKPYTPFSQMATGHSTLYFYILLASITVFGLNNFALRFPSAFFGIINILLFYLITGISFQKVKYFTKNFFQASFIPFILSFILITSRWYFNFARFSFEVTFLLFLELTAIYFLLLWRKTKQMKYIILTGIFSGFAFLSYYPGRIFFFLPLFFFFIYSAKETLKKNVLFFLLAFVFLSSPLLLYLSAHQDFRFKNQLFLTDKKLDMQKKISYLGSNIFKLSNMFTNVGDLNGRHNYPGKSQFNPVIGALFLFGFLVTILNIKKFLNGFFLFYFVLSLLPAIFTYPVENPNSLRTYTIIIPSLFFLGNGLIYLFQSEQKSKSLLFAVIIFFLILLTLSSLYDLRTYFRYQRTVFNKSFELNGSIRRIINLKLWEKNQYY